MSIKPLSITVPHPSTQRGHATHISYDPVNERLAYVNGKSVIIRPVDFKSTSPTVVFSKHIFPTTAVKFSPSGYYVALVTKQVILKFGMPHQSLNLISNSQLLKVNFK